MWGDGGGREKTCGQVVNKCLSGCCQQDSTQSQKQGQGHCPGGLAKLPGEDESEEGMRGKVVKKAEYVQRPRDMEWQLHTETVWVSKWGRESDATWKGRQDP